MSVFVPDLIQVRNALSSWAHSLNKSAKTKSRLTESMLFKCACLCIVCLNFWRVLNISTLSHQKVVSRADKEAGFASKCRHTCGHDLRPSPAVRDKVGFCNSSLVGAATRRPDTGFEFEHIVANVSGDLGQASCGHVLFDCNDGVFSSCRSVRERRIFGTTARRCRCCWTAPPCAAATASSQACPPAPYLRVGRPWPQWPP